jgi:hypothetical protein
MGKNLGSIAVAVFREKEKNIINWPIFKDIEYPEYPKTSPTQPYWYNLSTTSGTGQRRFKSSEINDKFETSSSCNAFYSSELKNVSQEIGTGFGETKRSEVVSISFDREKEPDAILEIFYNSRKQLEKLGINFNQPVIVISEPNSFPGENGYCSRPNR